MTAAAAKEKGQIPEPDEETLQAFSPSEMKLYQHATDHKWTVDELISRWDCAENNKILI